MFDYGGAAPARHVLGNYEIFEEVGRGGMGIVYRALDLSLDRIVAVKVLRDDLRAQPQIVSRFSREAKAAASLDHPNIVQIYSVGSVDGAPFIAMEFIDAVPLSTLMQRESSMPCDQALDIAAQVASALSCAHEAHVIHRDIKPPNILITEQGKAYVTDFGIAKILSMDDNLTVDGSRLGTPHYMSPERCKNGELTGSSDLYSLGVLLFQMLTGRLPYEAGSSVELIRSIVYNPPTRLRRFRGDLPDDVERLVAWMIEKQPKHRPVNGRTVCEAIQRVRQGKPLDTGGNPMITVFADFRQTFGKRTEPETPIELPRKLASGLTPITEALPESWRRRIRFGAVLLAVFVVSIVGYAWFGGGSDTAVQAWDPELANPQRWFADAAVAQFEDESPGVIRVTLNLPGFGMDSIVQNGNSGAFLVLLSGAKGTRHEGRPVVCKIDPTQRYASIVSSLLSQRSTMGNLQIAASALLSECEGDAGRAAAVAETMNLFWDSRAGFAVHPDGARIACTEKDERGRTLLTEWVRGEDANFIAGRQLAPPGGTIEALQYSPDGQHLAFVREAAPDSQNLWLLPANRGPAASEPMLEGRLSFGNRAFSPDGAFLAVATLTADSHSVARVIRTADGQIESELGEGWRVSWLPSGGALVGTAADRKGFTQVWRFETAPPYRRTQLTHLDGGTSAACTLSGDGAWVASSRDSVTAPALVIVSTRAVGF